VRSCRGSREVIRHCGRRVVDILRFTAVQVGLVAGSSTVGERAPDDGTSYRGSGNERSGGRSASPSPARGARIARRPRRVPRGTEPAGGCHASVPPAGMRLNEDVEASLREVDEGRAGVIGDERARRGERVRVAGAGVCDDTVEQVQIRRRPPHRVLADRGEGRGVRGAGGTGDHGRQRTRVMVREEGEGWAFLNVGVRSEAGDR